VDEVAGKPNVLFISIDDMNDWVEPLNDGSRGKPLIATPNIRELAEGGVVFTNAHTPVPLCRPTRASIMAGVYPRNGSLETDAFDFPAREYRVETLTRHFREQGWVTLGGGKIHPPLEHPGRHWDEYTPFERPAGEKRSGRVPLNGLVGLDERDPFDWGAIDIERAAMTDVRIADWAIAALGRDYERPFFIGVGFHFPHLPWYLPEADLAKYPLDAVTLPEVREDDLDDVPAAGREAAWRAPYSRGYENSDHRRVVEAGQWRQAVQAYSAANTLIDELVGAILAALDASGAADNTVVVLFSDHGWSLGEKQHWRKQALWEEATRVPLVIRHPGVVPAGASSRAAVSLVDLYPTLLEACGLPLPKHELDGRSLLGVLDDDSDDESFAITVARPGVSIRDGRWRLIRYRADGEELYDHANDPMEHDNLLADAERADQYAERRAALSAALERYHPSGS